MVLTCGVIFVPGLCSLFGFTSVSMEEFFISMGLAATLIPVTEIWKAIQRRKAKKA